MSQKAYSETALLNADTNPKQRLKGHTHVHRQKSILLHAQRLVFKAAICPAAKRPTQLHWSSLAERFGEILGPQVCCPQVLRHNVAIVCDRLISAERKSSTQIWKFSQRWSKRNAREDMHLRHGLYKQTTNITHITPDVATGKLLVGISKE